MDIHLHFYLNLHIHTCISAHTSRRFTRTSQHNDADIKIWHKYVRITTPNKPVYLFLSSYVYNHSPVSCQRVSSYDAKETENPKNHAAHILIFMQMERTRIFLHEALLM